MPGAPLVSVVVSTYNRAHLLPRLLGALEAQSGVASFEVVIVDDCSTDDTWKVLEELRRTTSLPLRVLRNATNSGPATGRNVGWRSATAPFLAFTDDDCVPDPTWLRELSRAMEVADVVQGRTAVDEVEATGRGPFARIQVIEEFSDHFETCNIGYRREVLESLGGFDERFTRPFGEDVDLGWRAVESGCRIAWEREALVLHDVEHTTRWRDYVAWVKDARRRVFAPLMVKSHPGFRARLPLRIFFRPTHPPTLIAMVGAARVLAAPRDGRRWLQLLLLALPYVHHRTLVNPLPSRPVYYPIVVPMAFVGDVAEVGAIVVGAVRFRTVLL